MIKNAPAMRETWVGSLGWEDPLEEGMATHSSILAWRIPWTEEPGGLQSMGSQRVGEDFGDYFYWLVGNWINKSFSNVLRVNFVVGMDKHMGNRKNKFWM